MRIRSGLPYEPVLGAEAVVQVPHVVLRHRVGVIAEHAIAGGAVSTWVA
jgi:hypothetical protein